VKQASNWCACISQVIMKTGFLLLLVVAVVMVVSCVAGMLFKRPIYMGYS